MAGYYIDISTFNADPSQIDWGAYKAWSSNNGANTSIVALRSSYGSIGIDSHYYNYLAGARNAGVQQVIHYHYAYPQYNSPQQEAAWQQQVVKDFRPGDLIMLDFEEDNPSSTSEWALEFMQAQQQHYGASSVILYSYSYFIGAHLQDSRLAAFPLVYALWVQNYPAAPAPWSDIGAWQYTDQLSGIPGVPGTADGNYNHSLPYTTGGGGGMAGIPNGWTDDGSKLCAPNGHCFVLGFRGWMLSGAPIDPYYDVPLEDEEYPQQVLAHGNYGPGSAQHTVGGYLWFTQAKGVVYEKELGAERFALLNALNGVNTQLQAVTKQLSDEQAANNALNGQITTLQAQVATLTAEVAQLQAQPISPQLQAAVNNVSATLSPIAKVVSDIAPFVK